MSNQQSTLVGSILEDRISSPIWMVTLVVVGSILLTISAKIQIPFFPVPMTMQTFAVCIIGMTLGRLLGTATILLYLLEGAIGLPVFANGGGLAYMTGPTGGYLIGFLIAGFVLGNLSDKGWGKNYLTSIAALLIGTAIIYILGVLYLSTIIGLVKAYYGGFLPFYPAEIFKILLATIMLPSAWKFFNKHNK